MEVPHRVTRYLSLTQVRPDAFHNPDPDGVIILTAPQDILNAEFEIKKRYEAKGHPQTWAECGLYYEDPWIYVVRDVVRFPDGVAGTYHHIILKGGADGVVTLPVLDGCIVLLRHFRNGARDWSWEIPRGGPRNVDPKTNALEELVEEIGADVASLTRLGALRNNNGMITETMHIYHADIRSIGDSNVGEGIERTRLVTPDEIANMIKAGQIDDCHTVHAFALARLHGVV